jgi:hypothetical protein
MTGIVECTTKEGKIWLDQRNVALRGNSWSFSHLACHSEPVSAATSHMLACY